MTSLRGIVLSCGTAVLASAAHGETVFTCGGSLGHAYYAQGALVSSDQSGWTEDRISDGAIQLVLVDGQPDILLKDAVGLVSARAQDGEVVILDVFDGFASVLVNYPKGAKELYTFDATNQKVYWTQHKFGVMIDKVAAFTADCQ